MKKTEKMAKKSEIFFQKKSRKKKVPKIGPKPRLQKSSEKRVKMARNS